MSRAFVLRRISGIVVLLAVIRAAAMHASPLFDPTLHFRTLTTKHFVIYFHQGEDRQASHLAAIAEETWAGLQRPLGVTPPPLTYVVLADQTELANGSATPLPYNTIIITATWPSGSDFVGLTDDWLRLVFTHEFTHIVHLDRSEGWARVVRGIFGRVPLAFPNLFLPIWQIEGLAVYEESVITGEGRLHAGDFQAIEEEARRAHAIEPLDRVNGGLTDWPGGTAPYAYGLGFTAYLADHYGADTLAKLADITARRLPYTGSGAFAQVYGKSLGALWRDYQAEPLPADAAAPFDDHLTRLTHQGFTVAGPRFAPPACDGCVAEVVYSLQTADGFPSLNAIAVDGSAPRTLTTRYLGSTSGVSRNLVVFDQQELRRNVGLYSDLYALDRRTSHVHALTSGARLLDPDLAPDGTTIVCVRNQNGQRDLVLVRLSVAGLEPRSANSAVTADATRPAKAMTSRVTAGAVTTLVSEQDTQFDAPRWSPDGRSIAVARHRIGHESEIVVVDIDTRQIRVVASDTVARFVTPSWRPDGGAILASSDLGGATFNVYEIDATSGAMRQLTHTTGGATWPDVSHDGRTILFVGYTTAGFDLFTMPYPASSGAAMAITRDPTQPPATQLPAMQPEPTPTALTPRYSPLRTLAPTSWTPWIVSTPDQLRAGVAVNGYDVLGYHSYALSATWLVTGPQGALTPPHPAVPDWQIGYAYNRWRPILFADASRATSFFTAPPTDQGSPTSSTGLEYQIEGGIEVPFTHVRVSHLLFASILRSTDTYTFPTSAISIDRTALRAGWATSTAHVYGYSISPEGGVSIGATAESVQRALGSVGDATTVTADARAYIRGLGPHDVIAIRVAGGSSTGNPFAGRTFLLGGSAPAPSVLDFGSEALSLLRGFPPDTFAGSRVALLNADYRWPLARPQRGHGTWPLFLSSLHAALFGDAGEVWTGPFVGRDVKTSAGAELSADFVAGYSLPFTATVGAGWGHDGARLISDGGTFYLRIGRAF